MAVGLPTTETRTGVHFSGLFKCFIRDAAAIEAGVIGARNLSQIVSCGQGVYRIEQIGFFSAFGALP